MANTKPVSDEEFEAANRAGAARRARGVAASVRYFSTARRLAIELSTGATLTIPVDLVEGLAGQPDAKLADVMLGPGGRGLRFRQIDADVSVAGLMDGIFGSPRWMAGERDKSPVVRSEEPAVKPRDEAAFAEIWPDLASEADTSFVTLMRGAAQSPGVFAGEITAILNALNTSDKEPMRFWDVTYPAMLTKPGEIFAASVYSNSSFDPNLYLEPDRPNPEAVFMISGIGVSGSEVLYTVNTRGEISSIRSTDPAPDQFGEISSRWVGGRLRLKVKRMPDGISVFWVERMDDPPHSGDQSQPRARPWSPTESLGARNLLPRTLHGRLHSRSDKPKR